MLSYKSDDWQLPLCQATLRLCEDPRLEQHRSSFPDEQAIVNIEMMKIIIAAYACNYHIWTKT